MNKWTYTPLGEVCDVIAGGTPSRKNPRYFGGDIPWVKISDMLQGTITSTDETITKAGLENSAAKILPSGTVLISIFATIGRTAVLGLDAATNQAIVGVIPKPKTKLNTSFLRYSLDSSILQLTKAARGVAQININGKILKSLEIPLPPLPEQERIVRLLDEAESLRKLRGQASTRMDDFVPALFHEMFGDPAINPKGWQVIASEKVFSQNKSGTKCGPFGSALKKHEYVDSGIPVWGIDNVQENKFIEEGSLFITEEKYEQLSNYVVDPGDILISRAGTVGRMCVAYPQQAPSIIGTNLIRLSFDQNQIVPEYFTATATYFSESLGNLRANADASAYSFVNTKTLKSLRLPLPPLDLQREFARRVSEARQVQSAQRRSEARVEALYQSMLGRAFAGEL